MCGIVGLMAPEVGRDRLEAAQQLLVHRGPDDQGIFLEEGVGLAMCRLSIIDLEGGHQPLCNEDGRLWVVFNGEIVNAPELRQQLEHQGHQFRTKSDTEVIVHAYENWGEDSFLRLRGMFAIALWDGRTRSLILARDRFGIKPLYYAQVANQFAFASEVRPLYKLMPRLSRRANRDALRQLFQVGFVQGPLSPFRDIFQLLPGELMVITSQGTSSRTYWEPQYPQPENYLRLSLEEATSRLMDQLRATVSDWCLSDVPVGSLLSGGLDSGMLASLLSELHGTIRTFHICFQASSHDESAYAAATAKAIGSDHQVIEFGDQDFDLLPKVVGQLETPQCSATSIPIYLLYRACHQTGLKVILTGEGADELLGGYHWFDGDRRLRPLLNLPQTVRRGLARLPLPVSAAGRKVLASGTRDPVARFALWHQVTPPEILSRLLLAEERRHWSSKALMKYRTGTHLSGLHPLNQFLLLEGRTRMVDFINLEVDRMSMANSVEARPPFLDHLLWEFVCQLPPEQKLRRGMDKVLLRLGAADLLPKQIQRRPKKGLATPHAAWWRRPKLPAWAEESLHVTALREAGYFDLGWTQRLRQEHRDGKADRSRILMGILTTQLWHQELELRP